jgi:hypothetical protein
MSRRNRFDRNQPEACPKRVCGQMAMRAGALEKGHALNASLSRNASFRKAPDHFND